MLKHITSLTFASSSRNDKLNWIFNVYDRNCGGSIDPGEMKEVVSGLYIMLGMYVPEKVVEQRTQEILNIVDVDGDGEISKEEFITKASSCDFLFDMLQVMDEME